MPALTINTGQPARTSSPSPPPVSPLTPTLAPSSLPGEVERAPPRQTFTHNQPAQVAIPPPAPEPIAFDSNPDVIALRSAISILQMQKQRATADIQALERVKNEAVGDPEAFTKDLLAGRVNSSTHTPERGGGSRDDDLSSDDADNSNNIPSQQAAPTRSWTTLPKAQDVVRCPPINWSQYAVVGESLDKLHAEQVARPNQGTPAYVGASGSYEFQGDGAQEPYQGVAAPYNPLKDKVAKKTKGKK
ncbi:hypothetical protein HJFPF1_01553 [Paramyrothecium foliicola]|nr:hypothetical protein HJFPF1_01553 [Paramyrothecium foliicola]